MTDAIFEPPRSMNVLTHAEQLNKYTRATLERHKRESLDLAVKARWATMAVIAVLLIFLRQDWDVVYYIFLLGLLALNGWLQRRVGQIGRSRLELTLIYVDLVIMTVGMIAPNPLSSDNLPLAMQLRYENFLYFFVILAAGTLAYSWRTVIAIGLWTSLMWAAGVGLSWYFSTPTPGLSEAANELFATYGIESKILDPNSYQMDLRIQEVVVFTIVALILALSVRRFDNLLMSNAGLERERANLSRYFSPNVVEELSNNDEPLKQVREQNIAVLFVDIVNFTKFTAERDPYEVIEVLRGFHSRMEQEVFRHNGTLDKYLGDGLMATFGTPVAGERDATNALECARAMIEVMDRWNSERRRAGEPEIRAGIGVHFGPAVLGDIGSSRLEFAVIGTAVNVSSRLEALTRAHDARVVMSDDLRERILNEDVPATDVLAGFDRRPGQEIRGIEGQQTVWALH